MRACSGHRQRGVAIITALLIVAIATSVSVTISTNLQLDVRRTSNLIASDQALMYTLAAESWARRVLRSDREENNIDHLNETWAIELPPLPVEGGYIRGKVTDLNACFNLNSLVKGGAVNPAAKERFERLLAALEIPASASQSLIDWLDPDVETTIPDGAEDGYYMGLPSPYRSANDRLYSKSELRLVRGFEDPVVYNRVFAETCALGSDVAINVNTAGPAVLRSLSASLTDADIDAIIEQRTETPFNSIDEFTAFNGLKEKIPVTEGIGVASSHFLVETEAQAAQARVRMYSIIEREESGRSRVLLRSQGVY